MEGRWTETEAEGEEVERQSKGKGRRTVYCYKHGRLIFETPCVSLTLLIQLELTESHSNFGFLRQLHHLLVRMKNISVQLER